MPVSTASCSACRLKRETRCCLCSTKVLRQCARPLRQPHLMFLSARVAGGEARRGGSCLGTEDAHNLGPNAFRILHSLARTEADDPPSLLFQEIRSTRIGFSLKGMVFTVEL